MKSYELFLDDVMMHAPGCTSELALHALRQSAVEFCTRTNVVRAELDPVDTEAGVQDYDFEPGVQQSVHRVMAAWYKLRPLNAYAPDQIEDAGVYRPGLLADSGLGEPQLLYQRNDTSFSLYPVPEVSEVAAVTVHAAMKPTRTATHFADILYNEWVEAIADGALYRLHASPSKPYTDMNAAAFRRARFERAVSDARIQVNSGRVRANLRVKQRPFV